MIFKTIGIISKSDNLDISNTINDLITFLKNQTNNILIEQEIAKYLKGNFDKVNLTTLGQKSDLIIVIGGDGSFISAIRKLVDFQKPILGVNRGKLGFLTDIHPKDFSNITKILQGEFYIEERFLLETNLKNHKTHLAVNDVILHPGQLAKMIEFDIFINNILASNQKADGLIVSTPTGSTAYALSAGGPIIHPNLNAILITPMYPHTLSSRPIIISDQNKLQIKISENSSINPHISFDGHDNLEFFPKDIIEIKTYHTKLKMIHHKDYDYYDLCRQKLNWGKILI